MSGDGLPALGQFVDNGNVHVGVERHGQGSRDGGCCHHQLMGKGAFVLQRHTLVYTKAVLFIDDHQG